MKLAKDYKITWHDLETGLEEEETITDCLSESEPFQMLIDGIGDEWQDTISDIEIECIGYSKSNDITVY